jgi:hypothetical protein
MVLATAADAVAVPRPRWRAVRKTMRIERRRRIAGWRASAAMSGVLAICAMLSLSSIFGVAVAQTVYPATATLPDPASPAAVESAGPTLATPTPALHSETAEAATATPASLVPLPTPLAEPET